VPSEEGFPVKTASRAYSPRLRDEAFIDHVLAEVKALRAAIAADAGLPHAQLKLVHANYRQSAHNLMHYLALRRRDLRPLQLRLATLGLSSLGRAESHVLATVDAVLRLLYALKKTRPPPRITPLEVVDFVQGQRLLAEHTESLLGAAPRSRDVRIMVTMPSQAADDYTLIHDLLAQGMDCMRINCAHDTPALWLRMIRNLRQAERALGRHCRVAMDLVGPKLRTGPLAPGPEVVKIRPQRDVYGRVLAPARVWLTSASSPHLPPEPADACLPLPAVWLGRLRRGERIHLTDARDSRRSFTVAEVAAHGCWVEAHKTVYLMPGSVLRHRRRQAAVGKLPRMPLALRVVIGDTLILTRDHLPGQAATRDGAGHVLAPAQIGCTLPEVFLAVRAGEPIWFNDGKIGGVVQKVEPRQVVVKIVQAPEQGGVLRADQGINLPETDLRVEGLTAKDRKDLSFVAKYADVVELSFACAARDVELLQEQLARAGRRSVAVVVKIENQRGFENLPALLLAAMRSPCCGVMIARGDLAVECGFERLAEVQEEILWICEAAHVPVIWATQVLETLTQTGIQSRAEITDAAMGHRAECVMLNKGAHVLSAVRVLDDILRRMQSHQNKKSALLRELRLAHRLPPETVRAPLAIAG
jgi:pyruvate kinase